MAVCCSYGKWCILIIRTIAPLVDTAVKVRILSLAYKLTLTFIDIFSGLKRQLTLCSFQEVTFILILNLYLSWSVNYTQMCLIHIHINRMKHKINWLKGVYQVWIHSFLSLVLVPTPRLKSAAYPTIYPWLEKEFFPNGTSTIGNENCLIHD